MQPTKRRSNRHGSKKTVIPHLKPLSTYSRVVLSDDVDSLSPIPSCTSGDPFCNFRVELVKTSSSASCKRQLDDSCLYETPAKKTCPDKCYSPDLGCVLDSFETLKEVKSSTPKLSSIVVLNQVNPIESKTNMIHQFDTPLNCDRNDETSDVHLISPPVIENKDTTEAGPAFSFDFDEIRSLSPLNHDYAGSDGLEHFIQSCQTFYEEQLSQSRDSSNSSKQNQDQSEGLCCKNECDEGYVTKSYRKESTQMSMDTTECDQIEINNAKAMKPTDSQTISPLMSTPLGKCKALVEQFLLLHPVQGPDEEQVSPILNHQPLKGSSAQATCTSLKFTTNTEALPKISFLNEKAGSQSVGTMIEKSLACHTQQQKVDPDYRDVSCEPSSAERRLDTTIPLQVQVKSKVVSLSKQQPDAVSIPAVKAPEPIKQENKALSQPERKVQYVRLVRKEVPRPLVFAREEDWEREKRVYVDSVTRHMNDKTRSGDVSVMGELLHLMDSVANQGVQSNGNQWQHPSDLTRRNYQQLNKFCQLSLDDWQNLNMCAFRRFAKVPKKFKRSPVL